MKRLDRLVALIVLLQSKRLIGGKEIAEYFKVSLRTVYRDINSICEAGVPVAVENGEGYGIMEGYHLPPVMFTAEEAAALFTGAKLAENLTDASIKKHTQSAIMKIKSVLPDRTNAYLERLQDSLLLYPKPLNQEGFKDNVLTTIQDAIVQNFVLKIEYYSVWNDEWTERKIEPVGISYYSNHWHIIAWCRLRNDIRDFRADRLRSVCKTEEIFKPRSDQLFLEYNRKFQQVDSLEKICIKVPKVVSFSLKDKLFPGYMEEEVNGKVVLTFWSPDRSWLIPLLLCYSTNVEILYPSEIKRLLAEQATQMVKHYS